MLPLFKKRPSPPKREYLYALEIYPSSVRCAVWSVVNSHPQLLSTGETVDWDDTTLDSLVEATDITLSGAAHRLDPTGAIQPEKVVLGLPSDWTESDKADRIDQLHLALIKNLTQRLSLKPIGFVITSEAVIRFLKNTEGSPPTSILLGLSSRHVEITLVHLGRTLESHQVQRSESITADVLEGLSRFRHSDMLPSRFLVYGLGDLASITQKLLSHPWLAPQTRLTFLHFPKIENLSSDFSLRAMVISAGLEIASQLPPSPPVPSASPSDLGFTQEDSPPPVVKLPDLPRPKSALLISALLLIVVGGLFASFWLLPRVTITLTVAASPLSHTFTLVADTQRQTPDFASATLPAQIHTLSVSVQKSAATTGSKIIGDKASGEVVVINGTSLTKTFPAGTLLTSPSGLKFILNTDVNVASASGTADPNSYTPGKASAQVTAAAIGTDSNLSAGTQFKIGSFSSLDYVAKNETAFSGGTSRQAPAVAKDDITSLRSQLMNSLKDKAESELKASLTPSRFALASSLTLNALSEEFAPPLDSVSDQLTGKISALSSLISLDSQDLDQLATQAAQSQVPAGLSLSGSPSYTFSPAKISSDPQTSFQVTVTAQTLPRYDSSSLISSLTGRRLSVAKESLSSLPSVQAIDISYSWPLPQSLIFLPRQPQNIRLVIQPAP